MGETRTRSGRAATPPRHWGIEKVYTAAVDVFEIDGELVEIQASSERPFDANDRPLPRRGNRYWPTLVRMEGACCDLTALTPEQARLLGNALLRAADVAEATDIEDVDVCGHWWPCACEKAAPS